MTAKIFARYAIPALVIYAENNDEVSSTELSSYMIRLAKGYAEYDAEQNGATPSDGFYNWMTEETKSYANYLYTVLWSLLYEFPPMWRRYIRYIGKRNLAFDSEYVNDERDYVKDMSDKTEA